MPDPVSITDGLPDRDWPLPVIEACNLFQSGDAVADPPMFYFGDTRYPIWSATVKYSESPGPEGPGAEIIDAIDYAPKYAVLTSQTCDIGEIGFKPQQRPWVMACPAYDMSCLSQDILNRVRKQKHNNYTIYLPELSEITGADWVADLRLEFPIEKSWLVGREPIRTFKSDFDQRIIGQRVAQLRSRPAWTITLAHICNSLSGYLKATKKKDQTLWGLVKDEAQELGARVDSLLAPTSMQICLFTRQLPSPEIKNWWDEFYLHLVEIDREVAILPSTILSFDSCTVSQYRLYAPIPFPDFERPGK